MRTLRTLVFASSIVAASGFTSTSVELHGVHDRSVGADSSRSRCRRSSSTALDVTSVTPATATKAAAGLGEIDDGNYQDLFDGEKAVLINACAPWCGPCKVIVPSVKASAQKWSKTLNVRKYNVEGENCKTLRSVLTEKGVKIDSLPTLVLFKGGEAIASRSGVVTEMDINVFLSRNLHADRMKQSKAKNADGAKNDKDESR